MSVSKLSRDRWRAQVHVPGHGNQDVSKIAPHLYPTSIFPTKADAKAAVGEARKELSRRVSGVTVREFRERWLTDRLFTASRPKESTRIHNRQQTEAFVREYGHRRLADVDHEIVSQWLAGGARLGQAKVLSAMFNDAASPKAGKLITHNPWSKLGLSRGTGRRYIDPPTEETVRKLIEVARNLSGPYVAAWLQVAAYTGMRPAEVDAMKWRNVDLQHRRYFVAEQFSGLSRTFTLPKNGKTRTIVLLPPAVEALEGLERRSEFCLVNLQGRHWTRSAFEKHWDRVRGEVGYRGDLYLATRHWFAWYATNVLMIDSEDVALQLGHEDGGRLVRTLYGHRDRHKALDRVSAAFEAQHGGNVVDLSVVREAS